MKNTINLTIGAQMMRKFLIYLPNVCCLLLMFLTACSKAGNVKTGSFQPTPAGGNKQWEYLIVSFGKTYFSDPNEQPEAKTLGISKLLSYSKAGIIVGQEALTTQKNLDTLGKFGWELVGVVGVIGGDQQMIFRRVYDSAQSKTEANFIREEGERLLKAQRDAAAELGKADLVDLDAVDRAAAINETRRSEEQRLKAAIETVKNYPMVEIKVTSTASDPKSSSLIADVTLDGNDRLLKNGRNYRTSEAESFAKEAAQNIFNSAGLKLTYGNDPFSLASLQEVEINVSVKVSNEKSNKIIATVTVGGKWPERIKS